jgi:hypothetical protein
LWLDWCTKQVAGSDVSAQHTLQRQWLAEKPARSPVQRWVFDRPGLPTRLEDALTALEAAWRLAMQVEATTSSRNTATKHPNLTGVVGSHQLRPHWWDAVAWGHRILETHPTQAQALVVLAEAEWAHGYAKQALLLLTSAWNLTATPSRALTERVRQWLSATGLTQELAAFDRVTTHRGLHGQAVDVINDRGLK